MKPEQQTKCFLQQSIKASKLEKIQKQHTNLAMASKHQGP